MLPLGVVLPTRNSRAYLERHLDSASWLSLAQQVVVVDSFSTDGTLEFLRAHLRHPNVTFLTHPPGLYQSWNFGIAQLKTDYTYISTIGETITRSGLEHLVKHIESLQSDVLVSPPAFRDENHQPLPNLRWPIHELLADLQVAAPQSLEKWAAFFYVCFNALGASVNSLLGSSASNLYRTAILQKYPFPGEWGTAGDTAWSVANVFQVKWSVSPMVCSTFLFHPKNNGNTEELNDKLSLTLGQAADSLLKKELAQGSLQQKPALSDLLLTLLNTLREIREQHLELRRLRAAKRVPWILNAQAWQARLARKRLEQKLAQLKAQFLQLRH